jgi:hypothetical protein
MAGHCVNSPATADGSGQEEPTVIKPRGWVLSIMVLASALALAACGTNGHQSQAARDQQIRHEQQIRDQQQEQDQGRQQQAVAQTQARAAQARVKDFMSRQAYMDSVCGEYPFEVTPPQPSPPANLEPSGVGPNWDAWTADQKAWGAALQAQSNRMAAYNSCYQVHMFDPGAPYGPPRSDAINPGPTPPTPATGTGYNPTTNEDIPNACTYANGQWDCPPGMQPDPNGTLVK